MLTKIAISEYVPEVPARAYQPAYTACTPVSPPSYGGGGGTTGGHTLTCRTVCMPASTGSAVIGGAVGGGYSTCQTVCS